MKVLILLTLLPLLFVADAQVNNKVLKCRWDVFGDDIGVLYIDPENPVKPKPDEVSRFCQKVEDYQGCVFDINDEVWTIVAMKTMCQFGFEELFDNVTCLQKSAESIKTHCKPWVGNCKSAYECSLLISQDVCGEVLGATVALLQPLNCQASRALQIKIEEPEGYESDVNGQVIPETETDKLKPQLDAGKVVSNDQVKALSTKKPTRKPHSTLKPRPTTKKPTRKPHSTLKPRPTTKKPTRKPHSTLKPRPTTKKPTRKPHTTPKPPPTTKKPTRKPHTTPKKPTHKPHTTPKKPTRKPHTTPKKPTRKPHTTPKKPTRKPHTTPKPRSTTYRPHSSKKPVSTATTNLPSSVSYVLSVVVATYMMKHF